VLGRGIRLLMDRKGSWRDNMFVERVWRSIKYEEVSLKAYESVSHARRSIGQYIELYNVRRMGLRQPHDVREELGRCSAGASGLMASAVGFVKQGQGHHSVSAGGNRPERCVTACWHLSSARPMRPLLSHTASR
jgi:hypothetical protein